MILGPDGTTPASRYLAGSESYTGASRTRRALRQWNPLEDDANSSLIYDLPTLRARSYDLYRNSPIGIGAINTTVTNVVGSGLKLQSRIDREVLGMSEEEASLWENETEREWRLFADTKEFDLALSLNFCEASDLFFRSTLVAGDCFALLPSVPRRGSPYHTRCQLIEASRVTNPNHKPDTDLLVGGIERDANGAPVWIHIENSNRSSRLPSKKTGWTRVPAFGARTGRRNVLHGMQPHRIGQARGVPYLAPVIETLKQLERYTDNELMAAVVSSMFTVFLEQPLESAPGVVNTNTATNQQELKLGNGLIMGLNPGEKATMANPARPNSQFDPFVTAIFRHLGAALELPVELLIKHFTASYSASRAAFMMAWKFFMTRRTWLAANFCQPIYEAFLMEAVALGRITAPGFFSDPLIRQAYLGTEWIGPAKGQIDEYKEGQAAELYVGMGVKTLSEVTAEITGGDWERKHGQSVKEKRKRQEDGLESGAQSSAAPQSPASTAPPAPIFPSDESEDES